MTHIHQLVAYIPEIHLFYAVADDTQSCCLFFDLISERKCKQQYRIYRRTLSHDQLDFTSLVVETMHKGIFWREFQTWYYQQCINAYCKSIAKINKNDIKLHKKRNKTEAIYYQSKMQNIKLSTKEIDTNNINDCHYMVIKLFDDLHKHLSIDFIAIDMSYFKFFHFLPASNVNSYSSFIFDNPLKIDQYDLVSKKIIYHFDVNFESAAYASSSSSSSSSSESVLACDICWYLVSGFIRSELKYSESIFENIFQTILIFVNEVRLYIYIFTSCARMNINNKFTKKNRKK